MPMETGQLVVQVYTSRAKLPIEGAAVVVTQTLPSGLYRLLSVQSTDSSGYTKPIKIATPDAENSTEPDTEGRNYSCCDVWAESPGFAMLLVEGVQIFPNIITIQPMELSPLIEGESSLNQTTVREITPQPL